MTILCLNTCQSWANLPENLQPLVKQLEVQGVEVIVSPWQEWQERADWVLPLCAWDYAMYSAEFQRWLDRLVDEDKALFNPLPLLKWNMSKDYLLDLAKVVEVIPTFVFKEPVDASLQSFLQENTESELVLKPLIGQSGKAVRKWSKAEPLGTLSDFKEYASGVVVQPYIKEIERYGETSMVFFNGVFNHAVKRQPPKGEWRANSAYGVEVFATEPSQIALESAQKVLASLTEMPTYARVDGTDILEEQRFLLNELEVIEPALYLQTHASATECFAQVLVSKMREKD